MIKALADIPSRWEAEGWWESPPSRGAKNVKKIYTGEENAQAPVTILSRSNPTATIAKGLFMAHVLLTFLGRVPQDQGSYRATVYDFGDGQPEQPTAFFGWPLQRRLHPEKLVILGTAGSMWEHLFEGDLAFGDAEQGARDALYEAVEQKQVTPSHLAPLAPLLSKRLGCEVVLDLIPYCRDSAEQVQLLDIMASHVHEGDRVDLDVTHGFRHLPMVALLSALQLETMRGAAVANIWYGAYDPDTGDAPVYKLSGLLKIAEWLQALHTYDKDGDYGVFAALIGSTAPVLAAYLCEAAFHEQVNNIGRARGPLRKFREALSDSASDPLLQLFAGELMQRTAWVDNRSLAERQYELAQHFLAYGDYLRAAVLGFESLVTHLVQKAPGQLDPMNHDHRDHVKRKWDEEMRKPRVRRNKTGQAYLDLRELRNVLAHGSRSKFGVIQEAISSEDKLREALGHAIRLAHEGARG
jgi:CRISPR-associated Csx2 family protein